LLPGVDISEYTDEPGQGGGGVSSSERLSELQRQYDELYAKVKDPKNFGNPSPYKGKIAFGRSASQESAPAEEYLLLEASYSNTAPISLAGWSLQSAVTGTRF